MLNRTLMAIALGAGLIIAGPALAKNVKVATNGKPIVIEIPDIWKASEIDRGIQIKSSDEEIFFWVEAYDDSELESIKKEHAKYFTEQGISFTGEPKITGHDAGNYGVATIDFSASWEGKPTVVRYLLIEPKDTAKSRLIVSYWASPEGDKTYDPQMQGVVNSLAAALDKM